MPRAKPFRDANHPGIPDDSIILDFTDRTSRQCLKIYAKLIEDENLRSEIEKRCAYYDRMEKKVT